MLEIKTFAILTFLLMIAIAVVLLLGWAILEALIDFNIDENDKNDEE